MSDYIWNDKETALNLGGEFYFYGDPVPIELFPTSKRQQDLIDAGALVKAKAKPKAAEKPPVAKPKPKPPPKVERKIKRSRR